ncbi:MAG: hypothetical protein E6J90_26735 [Deltaproteobacteria bacterium]|nr:MAG: hypothetical protein E6J91_18515 [Deltaproteobacteria bacterium]TMQ14575.1 MAG: hypothetical protein E6J90_26735 [Deltaproteobacteria bacterium]
MIGLPFGTNDTTCLTAASEQAAELVERRDPLLVDYAQQFRTTQEAYEHIRSLPQRDDEGAPDDGPKLEACEPVQRLRVPAPNPNCFERAILGQILGELLDPHPVRQLATLEFPWGRHTILLENGYPIVLDPRVSPEEIENGVATGLASNVPEQLEPAPVVADEPDTQRPTKRAKKRNRVAIDVHDALEYTTRLGEEATRDQRNGPHRAWLARNAIRSLLETRTPPTDAHTADALHWFFKHAEDIARLYGRRALTIVQTTAAAIWDLIDDVLAQQEKHEPRNFSFEIGGSHYVVPNWVSDAAGTLGKIGLSVGAAYVRPYLLGAGITSEMLGLVEQELNAEGYSLGPLAKQGQSISSVLAAIDSKSK